MLGTSLSSEVLSTTLLREEKNGLETGTRMSTNLPLRVSGSTLLEPRWRHVAGRLGQPRVTHPTSFDPPLVSVDRRVAPLELQGKLGPDVEAPWG
jgi:hypothetical protein